MSISLKRFTAFAWGHDNVAPETWVNPAQIAYIQPRIVTRGHAEATDGTLIYFQQEAGVLAVREDIDEVLAVLAGDDYDRELKLNLTREAARLDLLP